MVVAATPESGSIISSRETVLRPLAANFQKKEPPNFSADGSGGAV